MSDSTHRKDPIDRVKWLPARMIQANHYNPNVVFTPELRLLEHSLVTVGWVSPLLINENLILIDGFHRLMLALDSQALRDKYAESVPCAIASISDEEAMMTTVRMNRARGTHVATRMSDLVKTLYDCHGLSLEEIGVGIGATRDEVELLLDGSLLKHRDLKNYKYSTAWVPIEVSKEERDKEDLDDPNAYERLDEPE